MGTISEVRCSPQARALGVPPVGTAPTRTSFLLIDVPAPWERNIATTPWLAPVQASIARAAERGEQWRIQALAPLGSASGCRVIAHRLPAVGFVEYERYETAVSPTEAADAAVALIENSTSVVAASTDGEADLLVCTHGRRDVCCGSSGTLLWKEILASPELLPKAARLCRTSHTGGHRFAPTALFLPTGTCWAWLDVPAVTAIIRRDVAFDRVADLYRGSCALATFAEQVVEHAVLREVGWSWLDYRRTGLTESEGNRRRVELTYAAPDGQSGIWSAEVAVRGHAPVPDCGAALEGAVKTQELLAVVPRTLSHRANNSAL